jgi:glycosyltransferase involved in cell wall biosynthesis
MERYERDTCRKFAGTVTVSETDKKCLEDLGITNVFAISTGVDTAYFAPREDQVKKNTLVFTGSMDWLPNEDAILFFAREILEKIKQQIPTIKLTVVGRNPRQGLLNELKAHPEISLVGRVEDVRPFVSNHALYIIPLRIGGGTRIKAYEAMAMGKAVVSTSVGIEGLPVTHGENVILADTPDNFAQAVVTLLNNDRLRQRIARNARYFVAEHFGWERVASEFADICAQVAA